MPIYIYKAINQGCKYCNNGFEVRQRFEDKALKKCPQCGSPIRRVPTSYTFFMK